METLSPKSPEEDRVNTKVSFHSAVKKLVDANTSLSGVDLRPVHKKVLYPTDSTKKHKKLLVTGGEPITEEEITELRQYAFGPPDMFNFNSGDWLESSFCFNDADSSRAWSLKVNKEGCKGLIMCVQTYIIKHLLFTRRRSRGTTELDILMSPDSKTQEESLASSLSDILWKAGEKQRAVLCLVQANPIHLNTDTFRGDGVTERIRLFHFKKHDELTFNIKKYLNVFLDEEKGGGTALFLYSVILTCGYKRLIEDMEEDNPAAVLLGVGLNPCISTLMLTGRATPYLHNGIIYEGSEATMARPQTGTLLRAEIGFLRWLGVNDPNDQIVGSRLKTPSYPVWLTYCEGKYGILFNPNKDLMRDYHAETRFSLKYYSAHSGLDSLTTLTIDTREPKHLDKFSCPPLEVLIQTKWEDASVSWNDDTPYV